MKRRRRPVVAATEADLTAPDRARAPALIERRLDGAMVELPSHDPVERVAGRQFDRRGGVASAFVDANGQVSSPYRAVDTLMLMERRGSIDADMRAAGEAFRADFALASLVGLRASDLERVGGCGLGGELPVGHVAELARRRVWAMLQRVGGVGSLAGSCLWHVLGEGCSLREWATMHGRSREAAGGILSHALSALAQKNA